MSAFGVTLTNFKTGEQRLVVVDLSEDEWRDVQRNKHCAPCVVNAHASSRALSIAGPDFFWESVEPVVLH